MKPLFNISALIFTFLMQSGFQARADVVVSPVDRNPTALQNSDATYDANDVRGVNAKNVMNPRARKADQSLSDASRMSNRNLAQDETSAAVRDHTATVTTQESRVMDHPVAMNGTADQQQQMEETHSATPWLLGLLAIIVAGAIFYVSRRDNLNRSHRI